MPSIKVVDANSLAATRGFFFSQLTSNLWSLISISAILEDISLHVGEFLLKSIRKLEFFDLNSLLTNNY